MSERPKCQYCGEEIPESLEKRSEHLQGHYPSAKEWAEAYQMMQQARAKNAKREKADI